MTEYNKLVRDKIPAIIKAQGEVPNIRILDQEEYADCLAQKLNEEVEEFHREQNLEELADILEVVFALAESLGSSSGELLEIREKKREERGGFRNKVFLISKED